jgi:hypothetical protein
MNNGFLDDRGMPDLQKLVELFGDYSKITPEAWARWDTAMTAYHEHRWRTLSNELRLLKTANRSK